MDRKDGIQPVLCLLFLISGFTALVYQIVWVRLLTLAFGASAFAVAAVLIAFMGGMTIGSMSAGRVVDRRSDQLRLYAILEIAIGAYALFLPHVVRGLACVYVVIYQEFNPGFYQLSLIRLLVSVLILAIPTAAMGATLPLLCSLVARDKAHASRRTALLYAINTFGGILGCVSAGFFLIPWIGLNGTTCVAVAGNALIAVMAMAAFRSRSLQSRSSDDPGIAAALPKPSRSSVSLAPDDRNGVLATIAITTTALSGFTAMVYETIWTRILNLVIGGTVYAFTTMLAAFLSGLVLGSLLHAWRPSRRPLFTLAVCQLGIGLWVLLATPRFDHLPFVFLKIFSWTNDSWPLFQFCRFLMLFAILLVPTTLFGVSFPLAVQAVVTRDGETGRKTGLLYGFNTLGNVTGAFVGGFLLIPFVGLQPGLVIAAALNILAAMVLMAFDPSHGSRGKLAWGGGAAVAGLGAAMMITPWNLSYLNSGAYVYAGYYNRLDDLKTTLNAYKPIFYREAPTGTVAVLHAPDGTLSLTVDGKTDASTGRNADMSTQMLLCHLPALFAREPADSLLIGLGSGVSLGSLLRHDVKSVDVLEISPAVVEASHCFSEYNHDPLSDPRVNLIVADGRHHLERTGRRYDLIVSEPSNPWITGVSNLFTREYYVLMAEHLTPGGIACQWVPSYHMSKEMLGTVCKTFMDVFPNTSMWTSAAVGDLFLIGSRDNLELSFPAIRERLARPEIRDDLARIGMADASMLARTFKYSPDGLREFLASFTEPLPVNTDMHPILEFQSPRFLLTTRVARDFRRRDDLKGDLNSLTNMIRFREEANRDKFVRDAGAILGSANLAVEP